MIRALILDLDDTLYDELTYVDSGFRAVADHLAALGGMPAATLLARMKAELAASGRGRIFDVVLAEAGLAGTVAVPELVALYRAHRPELTLWPGVAEILDRLRARFRLAIVTDGMGAMQRAKVAALGIERRVDAVVYCHDLGAPKPDPAPFRAALDRLGAAVAETVVVGDNPEADMVAAGCMGCRSIRVLTGKFAEAPDVPGFAPTVRVAAFSQVKAALDGMDREGGQG